MPRPKTVAAALVILAVAVPGCSRNRDIPMAKSLTDYIFRWLAMEFVPGYKQANAPKRSGCWVSP